MTDRFLQFRHRPCPSFCLYKNCGHLRLQHCPHLPPPVPFDLVRAMLRLLIEDMVTKDISATGCSGKIVFFPIHCNPSLASIAVRDLQSSQRNARMQSLLSAGNFLYNQQQPSSGEGEVSHLREFLEKTQYLMNTLYILYISQTFLHKM